MKRKSKFNPFFEDIGESFNPKHFSQGGLYSVRQVEKDESLIGTKFVLYYFNFDLKSGETILIKPRIVEYGFVKYWNETHINLLQASDGKTVYPDFRRIFTAFVWSYENLDLAVSDYNHKVETMINERRKYLTEIMDKELKSISKNLVKRIK